MDEYTRATTDSSFMRFLVEKLKDASYFGNSSNLRFHIDPLKSGMLTGGWPSSDSASESTSFPNIPLGKELRLMPIWDEETENFLRNSNNGIRDFHDDLVTEKNPPKWFWALVDTEPSTFDSD